MEEDLALGLCIIKVLCLIVIAMSVHKMAYANEYFEGGCKPGQDPRYCSQRSDFNNAEAPVFWNYGSADDINNALQAAVVHKESDDGASTSSFGNRDLVDNKLVGAMNGM